MLALTAQQIAERATDLNLLTDRQLQEIWGALGSRNASAAEFKQALLRREMLTSYQIGRLERGDKSGYFYGRYKVLYLIGTGTFARVYRAVETQTGQIIALKVLRRRYDDKPEQREQFLHEGQVGMTLRHPNIVPIYDVGTEASALYFVMEFVEGRNLREFVKVRKCCAAAEAVQIISDVARGLDYALQSGVAHRDIKMSNVLISSRGEAKLVDFGLASTKAMTDDLLVNCANARTIDYAGLERACGVRKDDPRSDLYFVGCMLYNMVTGEAPLAETRDRIQRLSKTRFLQVLPVEKVASEIALPKPLITLINRAVQLDASARYQTPRELLADLDLVYGKLSEMDTMLEDEASVVPVPGIAPDSQLLPNAPPTRRPVMIVESNMPMQDLFRQRLKRSGFRVLVTSDPQRAVARFQEAEPPASCVVFSAGELGERALNAFATFVRAPATCHIPAMLLLARNQAEWADRGTGAPHHVVLTMPVTLRKIRDVLERLVPVEM
ncbi:MAG: protein kinase [Planctomycetia bacterium]|nr:protein kinase [Planctomycetia bacterium]